MTRDGFKQPDEWADLLDTSERRGLERDEPEGARYIQISDTLARQMAADLREAREFFADLYDPRYDTNT